MFVVLLFSKIIIFLLDTNKAYFYITGNLSHFDEASSVDQGGNAIIPICFITCRRPLGLVRNLSISTLITVVIRMKMDIQQVLMKNCDLLSPSGPYQVHTRLVLQPFKHHFTFPR